MRARTSETLTWDVHSKVNGAYSARGQNLQIAGVLLQEPRCVGWDEVQARLEMIR
jgi:hypothetical protein